MNTSSVTSSFLPLLAVAGLALTAAPAVAQSPVAGPPALLLEPAWSQVQRQIGGPKASSVAVDSRRGYVHVATAIGRSTDDPAGASDIALITYAEDGTTLRTRTFDGALGSTRDQAVAVAVDEITGTVYVTGRLGTPLRSGDTVPSIVTLAYGPSGPPLWVQTYRSTPPALGVTPFDMARDPGTGNLYIAAAAGDGTAVSLAYDATGQRLWRSAGRPGADTDIAVDPSTGIVYVAGSIRLPDATVRVTVTARTPAGATRWVFTSPTDGDSGFVAVDPVTGRVFVLTGTSDVTQDMVTMALSPDGEQVWRSVYDNGGYDGPAALTTNPGSDQVVVTGSSAGGRSGLNDYITIAYGTAGSTIWSRRYNPPSDLADDPGAIGVDVERGLYYVTGSSEVDSYVDRVDALATTIAYDLTGEPVTRDGYSPRFLLRNYPDALAVDPETGYVFVVGPAQTRVENTTWFNFVLGYPPSSGRGALTLR